jgi:Tfp pilus assembly protein PilZ
MRENRVSGVRYIEPRVEAEFRKLSHHDEAREEVDLDLTDSSEHNFFVGFDDALDGIFVATYRAPKVGERLALTINLPGSIEPVTGSGEVMWVRDHIDDSELPAGMGVRFVELEVGEIAALEDYLETRAPIFFVDDSADE